MMRKLSRIDREALTRALEIVRNRPEKEDPGRREQVDHLMKHEGWFTAADFCCYCCQSEVIRPRLWQPIPADIDPADIETILARGDDGLGGEYAAARVLRRMLRAGLSRYEPEPLKALAEAKRRAPAQQPAV
jgi:hypothetical protein